MLRQQAVVSQSVLLPESLIWTYVIQMTSALRHIHSAGLACRTLDPTKILIINKTRLLLNCCGIFDVLTFDPTSSNPMAAMAHYQQEDLIALGKIVLGNVIQITTREFLFRACKNIEVLSDFFFLEFVRDFMASPYFVERRNNLVCRSHCNFLKCSNA